LDVGARLVQFIPVDLRKGEPGMGFNRFCSYSSRSARPSNSQRNFYKPSNRTGTRERLAPWLWLGTVSRTARWSVCAGGRGWACGSEAEVEALGFGEIEWTGAAASEDGQLVAGLVDGAVAVDAFGDGEGGATRARGGDQFRRWARAEAGEMRGIVPGGNDL